MQRLSLAASRAPLVQQRAPAVLATQSAAQRRNARMLSQRAVKQEFEAPVPVTRNIIMAATLASFVGGVYWYTVQRIQKNTELGAEFEEIFKEEELEAEEKAKK
ncbi:Hypothetical Protein FCC1311_007732 [Hondaea fermentalgiana]|uniref:Uncharacterized protein n=1 Tax=Hondaea fermentalgiana TaxID=2315210 RepID=A0A2R5GA41_9STRA|nr:Hypothetical Protein FCC1311_007732 [Hondaea fermentalgiana]|eukprot:GBG24554.1 Hypothetical Protein FCC1311_007732 [Hondaea fermentalgiana]